jgi:hypothetical protein
MNPTEPQTSAPAPALGQLGARKPLGNLAAQQHRKHLRSLKIAILFVGLLSLAANGFLWYVAGQAETKLENEIARVKADPTMVLDDAKVAEARRELGTAKMITGFFLACSLVYIGLFFWVNSNPVGASVTALSLYILCFLIGAAIEPESAAKGIIIKILIIVVLFKGLKSALAIRELEKQAQAG